MSEPTNDDVMLSDLESRVLGCLMEKQMTTPDYYPLTLNGLVSACNQKSSRVPVMNLSPSQVGGVVNSLRGRGLVTARMDGRADKFEQHLSRKLGLNSKERAIVCVLMLRGALTLNEIRINTGRMVTFDEGEELQGLIQGLIERDEPLMVKLPRASGQREDRYVQLLCGEPDIEALSSGVGGTASGSKTSAGQAERITQLEQEVLSLRQELADLRELIGQR
ncbi:MAG TPA: YceH family protein [Mariprofundaceae bacterium]|nr:YceH family protein [Mariprofundaceae bacterium]